MNYTWLPFLLLTTSLSAQIITGVIEKISPDQLQLKTASGTATVFTDDHTKIWKSATPHAAAKLAIGDEIRVNYYGDPTSKMTAVIVSTNMTIRGVVAQANGTRLSVRIHHATEPGQPDCEDQIFVFLHPETTLGTSRKEITVGRNVQVKGWDVGDGVMEASHIAVYNTGVPVLLPRKS